jgi:hypothetical protein
VLLLLLELELPELEEVEVFFAIAVTVLEII